MAVYYIGADVHCNNTELAVEYNKEIVKRFSVPTTIPAIRSSLEWQIRLFQGRLINLQANCLFCCSFFLLFVAQSIIFLKTLFLESYYADTQSTFDMQCSH